MVLLVGLKQEVHPVFVCNGIIKVVGSMSNFEKACPGIMRVEGGSVSVFWGVWIGTCCNDASHMQVI